VVGCADWPRFAEHPDPPLESPAGAVLLRQQAAETAPQVEFPADPRALNNPPRPLAVGSLNDGLVWPGELGWARTVSNDGAPERFGCAGPLDGLPLSYRGDLDFFRFTHEGGALCLTVVALVDGDGHQGGGAAVACQDGLGDPQWEVPLYA